MLDVIKWLTFSWLTIMVIYSIIKLSRKSKLTINFIIIVYYIFFGLPLFWDVFIGVPNYWSQPGFYISANDFKTNIIYCIYVSLIPVFWFVTAVPKKQYIVTDIILNRNVEKLLRITLILFLFSPLILLFFAPKPEIYLNYAVSKKGFLVDESVASFHNYIAVSSVLCVIAFGGVLLITKQKFFITFLSCFPFALLAIWLNGKRFIVAQLMLIIFYVFWQKGILTRIRLVVVGLLFLVILSIYSFNYQSNVRDDYTAFETIYENYRIDYGRDGVTKTTIYFELNNKKILEYRGQSFLFDLTMYIPREIFHNKPYPYAVYFTSALLGYDKVQILGWTMTTSILEESISNLGWIGMVVGPLIISLICRVGDKYYNPFLLALTIVVGSMFLVVQLVAFAPIFYLWLIVLFLVRKNFNRNHLIA